MISRIGGSVGRLVQLSAGVLAEWSVALRIAAFLAGVTVGTVVVWLTPASQGWVALIGLLVGGALLGAVFRQWVGLIGVGLALFLWIEALQPRFGVDGPMPAGSSFDLGDFYLYVALVFGVLAATVADGAGLAFRRVTMRLSGWQPMRWLAIVSGLLSVAAICVSMVAIAPADASFRFTLPEGWSSVVPARSAYVSTSPLYCNSYAAGIGIGVLAGAGPESFTVPTLCATVVKFPYQLLEPYSGYTGSRACYYVLANGGAGEGAMTDWALQMTPPSSPIAGSYEEVRAAPQGDVIYGFGLERWRTLGPFSEHLCYVVALTVPGRISMNQAEANAILSTFSLR